MKTPQPHIRPDQAHPAAPCGGQRRQAPERSPAANVIANSPRMAAQRQGIRAAFGPAAAPAQLQGEVDLQVLEEMPAAAPATQGAGEKHDVPNPTGRPDPLTSGIEAPSGMDMADVCRDWNSGSDTPVQLAGRGRKHDRQPNMVLQLKWIDNGGKYLVWDVFVGTARWYFNKDTKKMFYRQAGLVGELGDETESAEKTRGEWLVDLNGEDPLAGEDASVVSALDYTEARERGNKENKGKKIVVSVSNHWSKEADNALYEIGNQWIVFGGDPMKEKDEHECSGQDWNTVDEGADVSHDMFQPSYRERKTAENDQQFTYLAHYEDEKEPIAVMILEVRKHESVQQNNEYMYLRWLVAHPTKGGGAGVLMKTAIGRAGETASNALRVESARSAIDWYQRQGLTLFKGATHETNELCGCGEMGTGGKFKDSDASEEISDDI